MENQMETKMEHAVETGFGIYIYIYTYEYRYMYKYINIYKYI